MPTPGSQLEILLIEDSPSDADLTIRALKRRHLNHDLIHLQDGEEALEFLFGRGRYEGRDLTQQPKVILLDLKLPKVDGLEVLRAIKADERTRDVPVVMFSSSREDRDVIESYRLGVNSYIVKPVEFENFTATVTQLGSYWLSLNESTRADS